MPVPIRIRSGSTRKHWPEAGLMILAHRLASGPDPFGQNLTQSARTKSDPCWLCTVLSGTSVEERNRVWKWKTGSGPVASCQTRAGWFLHTSLLPDQIRLAKPWPGHSDQIRVGCGKSDLAYTIWAHFGCTLAVMTTTGNQNASGSDPACLQ